MRIRMRIQIPTLLTINFTTFISPRFIIRIRPRKKNRLEFVNVIMWDFDLNNALSFVKSFEGYGYSWEMCYTSDLICDLFHWFRFMILNWSVTSSYKFQRLSFHWIIQKYAGNSRIYLDFSIQQIQKAPKNIYCTS